MGILRTICRRDNVLFSLFAVGGTSYFVMISSNTYFGKYYRKYLQKYSADGKPVPVKQRLDFQFKSAIKDLEFTEWNSQYITLFINKELDPKSYGSSESRHGIFVGVPEYFQESTEEGIMNTNILIDNKPVKWDSADGERFLQSLMLSTKAKKFILAHRLSINDSYYIHFKSALPLLMTVGAGAFGELAYTKLKLEHRPFVLTVIAAEDRVAELGADYIRGGIEYYEKRVERCKALRNLMAKGPKYFSVGGNETTIWRAQGMPNTVRVNLMKERLDEFTVMDNIQPPPVNPNPHPIL